MAAAPDSPASFDDLDLAPALRQGVADAGFVELRPIQAAALPVALGGRDVLGLARTGTGKTAAFALPILQRLDGRPAAAARPRALILAPTRELARQIEGDLADLGRHLSVRMAAAYGGVKIDRQRGGSSRGATCSSPVRADFSTSYGKGPASSTTWRWCSMRPALDMGFLPDVRRILERVPDACQTMFFSATMPEAVQALARACSKNPRSSTWGTRAPPRRSSIRSIPCDRRRGPSCSGPSSRRTNGNRDHLHPHQAAGEAGRTAAGEARAHRVAAARGQEAGARDRALQGFRDGEVRFLVATDLAARGLDVEGVARVVNFDVPLDPDTYVHRIGRTGRADCSGEAITIASVDELDQVRAIEARIGARIPRKFMPAFAPMDSTSCSMRRPAESHPARRRARRGAAPRGGGAGRRAHAESAKLIRCELDPRMSTAHQTPQRRAADILA